MLKKVPNVSNYFIFNCFIFFCQYKKISQIFNCRVVYFFPWFKVGLSPSKKICVICFIEIPLKMMKNAFYFILKALLVLKIFQVFVLTFWSCRENVLIRRIRLTSKFMTSQPGLQTVAMRILPNISQKVKATRQ